MMKILCFKMSHPGKHCTDYLAEKLGKEQSDKCVIESNATANTLFYKVTFLNYKENPAFINHLVNDEYIRSVLLINGKQIKQIKPI